MDTDHQPPSPDLREASQRLRAFRLGQTGGRLFTQPTGHPSGPTGFCYCEDSWARAAGFHAKAVFLALALKSPLNRFKLWALRRLGARVAGQVYLSHGVWIDPLFPELLTIEDRVFFGMGARIFTHEFRIDEFRAGRVAIRTGAFIGALAIIPCGIEIGARAVVAAGAVAHRDVPPGHTLIPGLARIVPGGRQP